MIENVGAKVPNIPYSKLEYDRQTEFVIFDALPSRVRRAINDAVAVIDVLSVADALHDGRGILQILSDIDHLNREYLTNAYADRGVSQ